MVEALSQNHSVYQDIMTTEVHIFAGFSTVIMWHLGQRPVISDFIPTIIFYPKRICNRIFARLFKTLCCHWLGIQYKNVFLTNTCFFYSAMRKVRIWSFSHVVHLLVCCFGRISYLLYQYIFHMLQLRIISIESTQAFHKIPMLKVARRLLQKQNAKMKCIHNKVPVTHILDIEVQGCQYCETPCVATGFEYHIKGLNKYMKIFGQFHRTFWYLLQNVKHICYFSSFPNSSIRCCISCILQ